MISAITDKVMPLVAEWQARPLSSLYPIVYLDGIHFKVRDGGRIVNKCAYTVLGVNVDGYLDYVSGEVQNLTRNTMLSTCHLHKSIYTLATGT